MVNGLSAELKGTGITNITKHIIYNNTKIMQNILYEADLETIEIVHSFILSFLESYIGTPGFKKSDPEYNILAGFYVGGVIEMIRWQGKQKNSQEFHSSQNYFIDLIKTILEFHIRYNT